MAEEPTITKEELTETIQTLYRSYNDAIPSTKPAQTAIYRVWWDHLSDLPLQAIQEAITWHQIANPAWMPRPMEIRTRALDILDPNPPPTPAEAWKTYLEIQAAGTYGNWTPTQHHPAVQKTIQQLATAKLTNSGKDRDYFTETYKENLTNWRIKTQTTKPKQTN